MSFGDISTSSPSPLERPSDLFPDGSELQGTLKALSANTATLRRFSHQLQDANSSTHPPLKKVRELREQNRDLARAAAVLASRSKSSAQQTRFQSLVEDFSNALAESVAAEQKALRGIVGGAHATRERETIRLTEGQVAVGDVLLGGGGSAYANSGYGSVETQGVMRREFRTRNEEAVLREIGSNDAFVRERNLALNEIVTSVDDVNSIFKDLAVMIGDQRSQVEYVEVAVGEAAENVGRGNRELIKTQERREQRKSLFFCMLLSIALIIALFLIILLS